MSAPFVTAGLIKKYLLLPAGRENFLEANSENVLIIFSYRLSEMGLPNTFKLISKAGSYPIFSIFRKNKSFQ